MAPRSGPDGQRGHHEAAAPLLPTPSPYTNRAESPQPRDTRFAISEDDAPDDADQHDHDREEEGLLHDELEATPASGHGRNRSGHKYPPSSLPPSYREAIYTRDPWYKSEVALSLQHYGRICFAGSTSLLRRYFPTSRFAQAGFFIIGLWIIVIISGPTWDKSAKMGWGKSVDEFLASIPPPPISGDGHFTSLVDWSVPSCRSNAGSAAVYCSRRSEKLLDIPHAQESFRTSDKIFVFADPPRSDGLSNGRGSIPTSTEVVLDGNLEGQVRVVVEAIYEKEMEPLLQRANVGWMAAGLRDRGVGIYTWPLPSQLRSPIYHYAPLSFKVTLHVAPGSAVPTIKIEGEDMDVGIFTTAPDQGQKHPNVVSSSSTKIDGNKQSDKNARADPRALKTGRLGHAIGRAQHSNGVSSRAADIPVASDVSDLPLFGNIWLKTTKGGLSIAGNVNMTGQFWSQTGHGSIHVAERANISAAEYHFESSKGSLQFDKEARIEARDVVKLLAHRGSIKLDRHAIVNGTRIFAETSFGTGGAITAPEAIFHTNHTLSLRGAQGVSAGVGVTAPIRKQLGVGTEQHPWVGVDAQTESGDIVLQFVDHQTGVPVRSNLRAPEHSVHLALSPEYFGTFDLVGSKKSSLQTPSSKDLSPAGRVRQFASHDHSDGDHLKVDGSLWWQDVAAGQKEADHPTAGSDDFGQVIIDAGKGVVQLSFDG